MLDFTPELRDAALMSASMQKNNTTGQIIERKTPLDFFVLIDGVKNDVTIGKGITGCGARLELNGSGRPDDKLLIYKNPDQAGNALYTDTFNIGNSKFWDYCSSLDGSAGDGVLQRHNIASGKAISFELKKIDADGELVPPEEPLCGEDCGKEVYIVNENSRLLTAVDDCTLKWSTGSGFDSKQWYSVEGKRYLDGFRLYYSKTEFGAMVKLRADPMLVFEHVCGDYLARDEEREWRYEPSSATGKMVLRLWDATGDVGKWYLGEDAQLNAVAVDSLAKAIHLTIGESPIYDPEPICGAAGDRCYVSEDCCPPSLTCTSEGKCDTNAEPEETVIEWWVWALIIGGSLLFMYIIYKMATVISKMDTEKFFEKGGPGARKI